MPSDSYYDEMDRQEDEYKAERERNLCERMNSKTLEEKVDFLIEQYIRSEMRR